MLVCALFFFFLTYCLPLLLGATSLTVLLLASFPTSGKLFAASLTVVLLALVSTPGRLGAVSASVYVSNISLS